MTEEYNHLEPGEEIRGVSGYYTMEKEMRIPHAGREALVVLGHTIIDNACCGAGGCRYALIPGFIVEWRARTSSRGEPVSLVEPIDDAETQLAIETIVNSLEVVTQIVFS